MRPKVTKWKMLEFSNQAGSLDLTFVFALDEVFAALVLREELELLGVNGSSAFLADQLDSILVLHPQLNKSCSHKYWSSA